MEDSEVLATLALSLVPGIGSQRLRGLVATFGSAHAALDAPQAKLAANFGIGPVAATAIKDARPEDGARVLQRLRQLGASVLLAGEPDFPAQLEEIPDPPMVLYVWGDRSLLTQAAVALVGSRDHTTYGAEAARILATAVAQRAVVVIEAKAGSGALVTADAGLEQGRPILAVPGPITSPTSYGCNKLIQQGAKAALCVADIFEEIGLPSGLRQLGAELSTPAPRVPPIDLTGLQLTLWHRMTTEPQHVDALVASAQTRPADVLGALTELERRGLVRQGPGMVFGLT